MTFFKLLIGIGLVAPLVLVTTIIVYEIYNFIEKSVGRYARKK